MPPAGITGGQITLMRVIRAAAAQLCPTSRGIVLVSLMLRTRATPSTYRRHDDDNTVRTHAVGEDSEVALPPVPPHAATANAGMRSTKIHRSDSGPGTPAP